LFDKNDANAAYFVAGSLLVAEAVLSISIIFKVQYTEIDWIAYMQEVSGFLEGEFDYSKLRGDTGPLVYPAGFVWIYSGLHWLTGGGHIFVGQLVFLVLYLLIQGVVLGVYVHARLVPPLALCLLGLSKRIHSIFLLRLFNDCFASFFAYCGVLAMIKRRIILAVALFSLGVSVKMNVLLMAPPVLALVLQVSDVWELTEAVLIGVGLQAVLALPFITTHPVSYLTGAFEFSRVFQHKWTVNLKFLPPELFTSRSVAVVLLLLHAALLVLWARFRWFQDKGGPVRAAAEFWNRPRRDKSADRGARERSAESDGRDSQRRCFEEAQWARFATTVIFTGNFIGIVTARSLHYQFYAWYFHTLPALLWAARLSTAARIALLAGIEWSFNVFPATALSSAVLALSHTVLLVSLWKGTEPRKPRGKDS